MKPTPPRAKALLAQYRRDQALPPALRARALHAIEQQLRAEQAPPTVEQAAPAPRPSWLSAPRGLLLGGALSAAVLWATLSRPTSDSGPSARPAPLVARSVASEPPATIERERRAAPVEAPGPSSVGSRAKARRTSAQPARSESARAPSRAAAPRSRASEGAGEPAATLVEPELIAQRPVEPSGDDPEPRSPSLAPESRTSSVLLPAPMLGSRAPAASASTLDAEVMQLREAHDRLRAGEPLRALSALAEHARRFPDSKLVALREVARMQALCDLGQVERAREAAGRFLRAHARSPYAQRVRNICDRAPAAPSKIE